MPERLPGLQSLRALAALMVLVAHVLPEAERYFGWPMPGADLPWSRGVDIFFVISGFIITLSLSRYQNQPMAFLSRRLWRVVPLYYLFTTLMVATALLVPAGLNSTQFDPAQILSSYGFFPYAQPDGRIRPILSVGWTLNYEVFFYGFAALSLALPYGRLLLVLALLVFSGAGLLISFDAIFLDFWTNPILVEFLYGIALAHIWQRGWRRPSMLAASILVVIGIALLVLLHGSSVPRFVAAGLPAAMIVAAGTLFCPIKNLPGQALGDASYALYLSHRFTLRLLTLILLPLLPNTAAGVVTYVAVTSVVCTLVALAVFRYVETPLLRCRFAKPEQRVPT